jgi:hypothetical protein
MNYVKFPDKSADELRTMFPQMVFFDPCYDASIVGINLDENCVVYSESKIENLIHKELSSYYECIHPIYLYYTLDLKEDISYEDFFKDHEDYCNSVFDWFNQIKQPREKGSLEPQLCYEPFEPRCTYIHKEPKIIDFDGDADDLPF